MEDTSSDRLLEIQRKEDLRTLLSVVIENSTIMPFRWNANKFICIYCGRPFDDTSTLKAHTKTDHTVVNFNELNLTNITKIKLDISEISCKRCPKQLKSFEEFLEHASCAHEIMYNKDISSGLFTFKLSDDNFTCHQCGQHFRFFFPLLKHTYTYHNESFVCKICGQGFPDQHDLDSHVKNFHTRSHHQCKKCLINFPDLKSRKRHYEDVHRRRSFECTKCPEILDSHYLWKRHLASVHDVKNYQFQCDICSQVFALKSKLVLHNLRVHVKEKTFTCYICGYKVFNKANLNLHLVKHDNSRPFQCVVCTKAFQRKKSLEIHMRIHTNDKRFVCKECGKAFVQLASLNTHLKVHNRIAKDRSETA